ncbi:hypothetical protein TNCV_5097451 [Trichonephila clavipes]|nr:hypothetical protein TNCV_5097451 [Trichonephila clavipes]
MPGISLTRAASSDIWATRSSSQSGRVAYTRFVVRCSHKRNRGLINREIGVAKRLVNYAKSIASKKRH